MTRAILAIALLLWAGEAAAATITCTTYDVITKSLAAKYAEAPISRGLTNGGKVIQIFTSKDGATWTAVQTSPSGRSCIMAAGVFWQAITPKEGPGT